MAKCPQDPLGIRAVLEAAALLTPLTGPTYLPMASSGTPIYDLHPGLWLRDTGWLRYISQMIMLADLTKLHLSLWLLVL